MVLFSQGVAALAERPGLSIVKGLEGAAEGGEGRAGGLRGVRERLMQGLRGRGARRL